MKSGSESWTLLPSLPSRRIFLCCTTAGDAAFLLPWALWELSSSGTLSKSSKEAKKVSRRLSERGLLWHPLSYLPGIPPPQVLVTDHMAWSRPITIRQPPSNRVRSMGMSKTQNESLSPRIFKWCSSPAAGQKGGHDPSHQGRNWVYSQRKLNRKKQRREVKGTLTKLKTLVLVTVSGVYTQGKKTALL